VEAAESPEVFPPDSSMEPELPDPQAEEEILGSVDVPEPSPTQEESPEADSEPPLHQNPSQNQLILHCPMNPRMRPSRTFQIPLPHPTANDLCSSTMSFQLL
jgi:hypothetical protein